MANIDQELSSGGSIKYTDSNNEGFADMFPGAKKK